MGMQRIAIVTAALAFIAGMIYVSYQGGQADRNVPGATTERGKNQATD